VGERRVARRTADTGSGGRAFARSNDVRGPVLRQRGDVSEDFYAKLGFARQEYPYTHPNDGMGQFELPQPPGLTYLAPSTNLMGLLLLPRPRKRFGRTEALVPNPVLRSGRRRRRRQHGGQQRQGVDFDKGSVICSDFIRFAGFVQEGNQGDGDPCRFAVNVTHGIDWSKFFMDNTDGQFFFQDTYILLRACSRIHPAGFRSIHLKDNTSP
jgi:hypothetical protein